METISYFIVQKFTFTKKIDKAKFTENTPMQNKYILKIKKFSKLIKFVIFRYFSS
jgi:hypothetical protein